MPRSQARRYELLNRVDAVSVAGKPARGEREAVPDGE